MVYSMLLDATALLTDDRLVLGLWATGGPKATPASWLLTLYIDVAAVQLISAIVPA